MNACDNPGCLGNYNFDKIAFFAKKRFVEGWDTIELMEAATSEREKEEIALVSFLDLEDDEIRDLQLCCRHAGHCEVMDCRDRLKKLIEAELGKYPN
jgi:hypothetical protein